MVPTFNYDTRRCVLVGDTKSLEGIFFRFSSFEKKRLRGAGVVAEGKQVVY